MTGVVFSFPKGDTGMDAHTYRQKGTIPIRARDGVVLVVSEATKSDLREILALQYSAYQSEAVLLNDYTIPPLKQTLADIESEFATSLFLKATDTQEKIVGSVRGRVVDGALFIGKLIVHPSMQGRGVGTELLNELERICDCTRCELFTSSKSVRNIRLYERVGYSIYKEEKISDRLTFVYLQKISVPRS
jgi:ribosomal protein S18 acetylase RimI-like enzyme